MWRLTRSTLTLLSSFGCDLVQNPVDALHDCFCQLEYDRMTYAVAARRKDGEQPSQSTNDDDDNNPNKINVAYAFQLQLYTRSTLSDIYKGLRGGSWFSIPTAQFTRNAITPFLNNCLLRWMIIVCEVVVIISIIIVAHGNITRCGIFLFPITITIARG